MEGAQLEGWIDEPWARRGSSRAQFFQKVLERFCPTLMTPLMAKANENIITRKFEFWSDAGLKDQIYRAMSNLFAFDWDSVGFLACQNSDFIHRLTNQSRHEFNRAKTFLQNFTAFCGYHNLKIGPNSERFDSIMADSAEWRGGMYVPVENEDADMFHLLVGKTFVKRDTQFVVDNFSQMVLTVKNPLNLLRVIAKVIIRHIRLKSNSNIIEIESFKTDLESTLLLVVDYDREWNNLERSYLFTGVRS